MNLITEPPATTNKALIGVGVLILGFCIYFTARTLVRRHSARYTVGVIDDIVGVAEGGPMAEVKYLVGDKWFESSVNIPSSFDIDDQKNVNDTFLVEYQKTDPGNFDFLFSNRIHVNVKRIPFDGWKKPKDP